MSSELKKLNEEDPLDRCTRALYQRDYGPWPPRPGNDADAYNADQCRATAAVVLAALEGGTGE